MRNEDAEAHRVSDWSGSSSADRARPQPDLRVRTLAGVDEGLWTLLCIDDEPSILTALSRVFHHEGWRMLFARSALEAFDLLARHNVGVIICDQVMPGAHGTELLKATRTQCPNAVHVILTGSVELDSVARAVEDGEVFQMVEKPWDDDNLRQVVRSAFLCYSSARFEEARVSPDDSH